MGGHPDEAVPEAAERGEVGFELLRARGDGRQFLVAVHPGAAVPRAMLDHPGHPGTGEAFEHRPAERRDAQRLVPQRAIADHIVRAFLPHVEQRQAINADPRFCQIEPKRLGMGAGGLDRADRGKLVKPVERRAGRIGGPDRWLHPRNPATFLIDADEGAIPSMKAAQVIGQRAQLGAAFHVAAEQDVARRIAIAEEGALVIAESGARQAKDRRQHVPRICAKPAPAQGRGRWITGKSPYLSASPGT